MRLQHRKQLSTLQPLWVPYLMSGAQEGYNTASSYLRCNTLDMMEKFAGTIQSYNTASSYLRCNKYLFSFVAVVIGYNTASSYLRCNRRRRYRMGRFTIVTTPQAVIYVATIYGQVKNERINEKGLQHRKQLSTLQQYTSKCSLHLRRIQRFGKPNTFLR